jgi:preprotein translocase subunit SecA
MIRKDHPDAVYKTVEGKLRNVIGQIEACHQKGQPVLVGTISIESSEVISSMLKKRGIPHEVLNAKHHEREAYIVAQAGRKGAVTIATNMAGRGTDIVLGGNAEYMAKDEMRKAGVAEELIAECTSFADTTDENILAARAQYNALYEKYKAQTAKEAEEVKAAGGLFILGTERHDSRRIDNQLRGRAGRQGDPGESRFFLSLQDDLMRLFGSDRILGMVETLGLDEDTPIEHKMLSGAIESSQKKVEGRNFEIRKHVLQFDDVMNQQRNIIYAQRQKVLEGENIKQSILKMIEEWIDATLDAACASDDVPDNWNYALLAESFEPLFLPKGALNFSFEELNSLTRERLREMILDSAMKRYEELESEIGEETMRELERVILLRVVDQRWMDHIDQMDELKRGINLRAYGQRDPVVEYKFEGFAMFEEMIASVKEETTRLIYLASVSKPESLERKAVAKATSQSGGSEENINKTVRRKGEKVGRNDPCPCGSGKKYKKCCGA